MTYTDLAGAPNEAAPPGIDRDLGHRGACRPPAYVLRCRHVAGGQSIPALPHVGVDENRLGTGRLHAGDGSPGEIEEPPVLTIKKNRRRPTAAQIAAFQGIATAAQLIDLDQHEGEHPRLGATDVVPFVPISNISMDACVEIARRLGQRVAEQLDIPVYLYEEAASRPDRKNLERIRRGEFPAGIVLGAVSVGVGLLNAACMIRRCAL